MTDTSASSVVVCRLEDIEDPGSKGMTVSIAGQLQDIFVVRQGDSVFGYLNSCPHTGGPLDWTPDRFLDLDGRYIQCAMHAALFRVEDGRCIAGPCNGDRLTPVPVEVDAGVVRLEVLAGDTGRQDTAP
jgi:nitrite reductase/ring-hydroxylating ferredoxin subunit